MFKLEGIDDFKTRPVQWGPIGELVYLRTYSRTKDDGTKETWFDTCKRVVEGTYSIQKMHCIKNGIGWSDAKAMRSAQEMFSRMFDFKWLPPGRGLWSMGTKTVELKGGAVLNNCGFISTENMEYDPVYPFIFLMDMSMLGVGMGFDCEGAYTGSVYARQFPIVKSVYTVEDSREGWLKIVERLLLSIFEGIQFPSIIDFSKVRKKGELLAGMGGVASGPEPLMNLLLDILTHFAEEVVYHVNGPIIQIDQYKAYTKALKSSDIVDLMNYIGKCVVSGGVRRSAEIAFGRTWDHEFMALKEDEEKLASHRWASNNSILVHSNDTVDYDRIADHIRKMGEPGIFWIDNARYFGRMNGVVDMRDKEVKGANPCIEQSLFNGELCNVVEQFLARHDSLEDFLRTIKYAYLYAKTVTLIPTHRKEINEIVEQNRRIGTSVTGVAQFLENHSQDTLIEWLKKGYAAVQYYDTIYSDWLKINRSIKTTSVKPSGTVSLLPGATPGIHYPHSEYSIRRVRIEDTSPLIDKLKNAGYVVEIAVNEPNTVVVEFPIWEKCSRTKKDISIREQFELTALLQEHWADNQVSVTIHFKPEEAEQIADLLREYSTSLKAVSLLPLKADSVYVQAPYQEITREEYLERIAVVTPVVLENAGQGEQDKFCDSDSCKIF